MLHVHVKYFKNQLHGFRGDVVWKCWRTTDACLRWAKKLVGCCRSNTLKKFGHPNIWTVWFYHMTSNFMEWQRFCLYWGFTSQSTIFQSCRDGATASWVINQYFRGVKCLAQGHNTVAVGFEPPTSRSRVRHSTTEPPCWSPWSDLSVHLWILQIIMVQSNRICRKKCC